MSLDSWTNNSQKSGRGRGPRHRAPGCCARVLRSGWLEGGPACGRFVRVGTVACQGPGSGYWWRVGTGAASFQLSNRPRLQRTPTTFLDQRCSTLHWSGATSRGLHFSMPAALCEPPRVYDPPAEGEPPKRRDATRGDQRTERPHTYGVRTSTDQSGVPHIQRACTRGDVATVVKLLRAGVDCGCETEAGLNLLHLVACGSGSVDVARKLLQVAPDLAARKCNRGWTPLMHAGSEGNWAICELLEGRRP